MAVPVVVFGPGPSFKGGISNFTVSLSLALEKLGYKVHLVSWSSQYPAIIPRDFLDRNSRVNLLEDSSVKVRYMTDFNRPATWYRTAQLIAELKPKLVVIQWAIAIQGLPLGKIARRIKKVYPNARIVFDVHNLVQKEAGLLDRVLTRYALKAADEFILHGESTLEEFKSFLPEIPLSETGSEEGTRKLHLLFHPVYDLFKPDPTLDVHQLKSELGLKKTVFLFFGFIRKYKGLHNAIEAFAQVAKSNSDCSLLIVGESFWNTVDVTKASVKAKSMIFRMLRKVFIRSRDQERDYRPLDLIKKLGLEDRVVVVNRFVPNEEVHQWFQISDAVVNYYEYATPSGVESIAYNFGLPILATRVGHFSHAIKDGQNGYLAEPEDQKSMADAMLRIIENPIPPERVRAFAEKLSWKAYAEKITRGLS